MRTNPGGFSRRQLGPTLAHAARHPFYQEHWADFRRAGRLRTDRLESGLPDAVADAWSLLADLPPTERRHLVEDLTPVLADGDEIVGIGFSSGSSGSIVSRYVTARERTLTAALTAADGKPRPGGAARPGATAKPVRLEFVSTWHGVGGSDGPGAVLLPGTVVDDEHVERTIHMLRMKFAAPGITRQASMISGGIVGVYAFTRYLVDNRVPVSDFAVRVVGLFGGYLGRRRRDWLGEYWQCPVIDSFSVSECRGKALVCPKCGHLAFDPQLVAQAVALDSDDLATAGTARLALTELFPFGIAQPVVKYLTGDLVEVLDETAACCAEHVGGLRRVGRLETSTLARVDGVTAVLVPSQVLYDAFDRPGVCRADVNSTLRGISVNDVAQPYVHASLADDADRLRVVFRYRPDGSGVDCEPGALAALRAWPPAKALVDAGRLGFDVVADSTTGPPRVKFA